jgi:hypothetical protein
MPITVGPMQLIASQATDVIESQVTGTDPDGGFHTNWSRLSGHDHSGGLLGNPVAVTIPDGSITTADLDPSVLAPYVKRDGTTPISGTQELQADAIIRDALYFGQQGSASPADATISRTGAGLRVDSQLGVGSGAPQPWGAPFVSLGVPGLALMGAPDDAGTAQIVAGAYYNGGFLSSGNVPAVRLLLQSGAFAVENAPSAAAAGTAQTFTTRAQIAPTGTLTLTPDAGQVGLSVGGSGIIASTVQLDLRATAGNNIILTTSPGQSVYPVTDNTIALGNPSFRWTAVYAVAGTINTSSRDAKEGITPLDPVLALEAVRSTPAVTFTYTAPEKPPEYYDLPDDPEQAQQVLEQQLRSAPLEAAARQQAGFVAEDAHSLFLVGEGQTSPGNSVGVLLAALQAIDARLTALEAP